MVKVGTLYLPFCLFLFDFRDFLGFSRRTMMRECNTSYDAVRRSSLCSKHSVDLYPTKIATSLASGAREAGRAMWCLETQLISINKAHPAFAYLRVRDPTADECHDESYNARLLAVAGQALFTPAYILTSISYSLII